jgi:release factor glutamine methyltransferase
MTLVDHVSAGRTLLRTAGIGTAEASTDAEVLARCLLGWDRARYLAGVCEPAPPWFSGEYARVLERRAAREPVSLIVGRREFWGLEFEVTRDVLTPRPETELLVQEGLACAADLGRNRPNGPVVVDVGTGSGCVAISLTREIAAARVVATDISGAALAVARRNAARHGVSDRVSFVIASLLEGIRAPVDLVVSNPPYVPTADLAALPPEVRNFEPASALAGGPDGLDVIRALADQAQRTLAPGGWLVIEFGHGQEAGLRAAIAERPALELVRIRADLQRIPRTAVLRRRL